MELTFSKNDIEAAAVNAWRTFNYKKIWVFYGDMGSGKTTFIHEVCKVAGVRSAVSSPTYSIINEYSAESGIIFHMGLYRLKDEEEVLQAGVEDAFYSGNYCFVEWPQKAENLLPSDVLKIMLDVVDNHTRRLTTLNMHG